MLELSIEKRTVRDLRCDENTWSWKLSNEPNILYFTNNQGEGIFYQKTVKETNWANECDIHQITGTCQFSLTGYSISGARKKLNRILSDNEL